MTDGQSLLAAGNPPPSEPSALRQRLYEQTLVAARGLGGHLRAATAGGVATGNFTAALGIPTIDGLGAGAHARLESVDALPLRAALRAGLG